MKFVGRARVGLAAVAPGVGLASLVAIVARLIGAVSPPVISEVPVAVALGLVIGHWVPLPSLFSPGLRLTMKRFLRTGIALLGAQLSFAVVLQLGVSAVGIIVALAAGTLLLVGLSAWFGDLARLLVLIALAGVGLSTRLSALREVGIRYLYLGLVAALALAGASLVLVSRFAPGP